MQKELEKSEFYFPPITYCLPDGSSYICSYLPSHLSDEGLLLAGEEIISDGLKKSAQTRICIDSREKVNGLGKYLKVLGYDAHWGGNAFFEAKLGSSEAMKVLYPKLNWQEFSNEFTVDRVDSKRNKDRKVLKSLMLGSFVLKYLPALSEVQLHSVAGISADSNIIQMEGKLAIIMAGVFEAIEDDYPQSQSFGIDNSGTVNYSGVDKLTFSASRVAVNYEKLGLEHSTRSGLVINYF